MQTPSAITYKYSDSTPEQQWLTQAKQGTPDAFGHIVNQYERAIFNLCLRMLDDPDEAEDAAQETFIRAYLKLDTYDESRKFSTWLFAIASHYCLDCLKKRRLQQISWDELPFQKRMANTMTQPEQAALRQETPDEVQMLLKSLNPEYRTAIILKYWYDMSCEEIAETMDTTVGATKSRLFRARQNMASQAADIFHNASGTTARQIPAAQFRSSGQLALVS